MLGLAADQELELVHRFVLSTEMPKGLTQREIDRLRTTPRGPSRGTAEYGDTERHDQRIYQPVVRNANDRAAGIESYTGFPEVCAEERVGRITVWNSGGLHQSVWHQSYPNITL